jgi:hypothetical protein
MRGKLSFRFRAIRLSVALLVPALGLSIYFLAIRPSQLRWGATAEEAARAMPGDDLIAHPSFLATRAITIRGRPEDIWPWLVQMGYGRAGFYGYDLIENPGGGRGIRSANAILPELQHPKPGDVLPLSVAAHLVFSAVEPNQYLLWRSEADPADGVFTWALYPLDRRHTRLVSRIRLRYHWQDRRLLLDLFTEFCDHVAVPAILRGIRARVEGTALQPLSVEAVAIAVWLLALAEIAAALVCLFRWSEWGRAFLLALAAMTTLLFALYAHQPIWIGAVIVLAVGSELLWMEKQRSRRTAVSCAAAKQR